MYEILGELCFLRNLLAVLNSLLATLKSLITSIYRKAALQHRPVGPYSYEYILQIAEIHLNSVLRQSFKSQHIFVRLTSVEHENV